MSVRVSQAPTAAQVRETHESAGDGEVLNVDVRIAALDGSPEKLEDSVSLCLLDTPGECLLLAQQQTSVRIIHQAGQTGPT